MPTAQEIALDRDAPVSLGLLRNVITATPLFSAFDARTSPRTRFKTLCIDALPTAGFVNLGDGFKFSKGRMSMREFGCSYIGALVMAQLDVAREWQNEHQGIGFDYFSMQAALRIEADLLHIEKQMVYGTANDALGFPGMKEITPGTDADYVLSMTETPDDTDFTKTVINVGGSTSNTGSSAYAIMFGELGCQIILGGTSGTGELFQFGERRIQSLPPDANKPNELAEHEVAQMSGHIGLSVSGFSPAKAGDAVPTQYSLRRAMNITRDNDCGMDDYVAEKLVLSFPEGKSPNILAMSHRSGDLWAKARKSTGSVTFVGNMGSGRDGVINRQPQRPKEYEGVPVVYTKAIRNNEAIEVPA